VNTRRSKDVAPGRSYTRDVVTCPPCGKENSRPAKFCLSCGSSLSKSIPTAREQRKVVTLLFCDITGSTELGETLDPETLSAVGAEPLPPLELKGKSEPFPAWRLLTVLPDVSAVMGRSETPFVGREREVALLEGAFAATVAEQSCRVVTVLGEPGIGKSRLACEFVALLEKRVRVLVGRCLPYGEGITYWPLVDVVKQLGGSDPRPTLADLLAGEENAELIAELVVAALGRSEHERSTDETHWAVRRLFETLAREQSLLVVLEDLHWAEPTFLDLVEYVSRFSAEAPILVLALARPELLESRPWWATVGQNAELVFLEPLGQAEIETLIERVAGETEIAEPVRARIVEVAEGNPLFVEQLLAMLAEGARDDLAVPPTVQALLAARIDRLGAGERAVIERASVEGRGFHRGAVAELLPAGERGYAGGRLLTLVRKGLIGPGRAEFPEDDGFRFAHALIRDAAYESIPKALRADLHERFAAWLEGKARERAPEYEEVLGYHLEQAYHYRVELGSVEQRDRELGARAADKLASAARRARARGDYPAAVNLLIVRFCSSAPISRSDATC
jgi:predicted ATPase